MDFELLQRQNRDDALLTIDDTSLASLIVMQYIASLPPVPACLSSALFRLLHLAFLPIK